MSETSREKIKDFILDCVPADEVITEKTPLFSSRLIDSLELAELVIFLEDEWSIKVDKSEIEFENFDNIELLSKYVERKVSAR